MIYCGYQGVGKSTYCREHPNTTKDLDSSHYPKREKWYVEYVADAKMWNSLGLDVFISAHPCVIAYLRESNIEFTILAPSDNRGVWLKRLEFRYVKNPIPPNLRAIHDFEENYERDMAYYKHLEDEGVRVKYVSARIVTTIGDFITQ